MRMWFSPRNFYRERVRHRPHFSDLEPSEDHVESRLRSNEAKRVSALFRAPERSEEEEQIASPDAMPRQMALRGAGLAEDRTPSASPRSRVTTQVRIEMRAVGARDPSARKALDYRRDA